MHEQRKQKEKQASEKVEALEKLLAAFPAGDSLQEYRELLEKDLAKAKKAGSVKNMAAQIEAKAGFVERETKRLKELEADVAKATEVLKERKVALAAEQAVLAAMKEELAKQGAPVDQNVGTASSPDALERQELAELREFASLRMVRVGRGA